MRRWVRAASVTTGVMLVAIQIVRPVRSNPPAEAARGIQAAAAVDPAIGGILHRSCNDCHSNSTVWPWYSHVAPVSWVVAEDVHQGRRALNLSEWASYTPKQKTELMQDMCEEVSQGEMPGALYVAIHRQARLSDADRQQFCAWTNRIAHETATLQYGARQDQAVRLRSPSY